MEEPVLRDVRVPSDSDAAIAARELQAQAHVCRFGARTPHAEGRCRAKAPTPERRQSIVHALISEHRLSQRRACQAAGLAQSTLRYTSVACDDSGVINFIQRYVALNPCNGFGLLYTSARYQEQPWGKTVLWRGYCQLKLNLSRRGKKRLPQRIKQPLEAAHKPNLGWSCDFMSDALWSRLPLQNLQRH